METEEKEVEHLYVPSKAKTKVTTRLDIIDHLTPTPLYTVVTHRPDSTHSSSSKVKPPQTTHSFFFFSKILLKPNVEKKDFGKYDPNTTSVQYRIES